MRLLRVYRALLLATFQAASQYRVQSLLWVLFAIMRPLIFLAAWSSVATAQGGSVSGMTIPDFVAYYLAVSLTVYLTMAWNAWEFEQEVRLGRLSPKLLRPLHPLHYAVVDNLVWKVTGLIAIVPGLLLIALSFEAPIASEVWNVLLFVPSVLLAAALRFTVGWVVATLAFWTTRVTAVEHLLERVAFIFAGQIAPLSLLPGPLQAIAYLLPWGYMLGVPADILRGGLSLERALLLMGGQLVWLVLALAGLRLAWRTGLRQYGAVGA